MSPAEKKKKAARLSIRQPKHTKRVSTTQNIRQPIIVKSSERSNAGAHSLRTSRYAIGYVLSGHKYIYMGDLRCEIGPGDVFFLTKGTHYTEEVPDNRRAFEQIVFFYTPEQIGRLIAHLGVTYDTDTCVHHTCEECMCKDHVIASGWKALKAFFNSVDLQLRDGFYNDDPTAETLSLTSLIYHIISRPEGCLRTRILGSTDPEKELMERQIHEYVFSDITLEQLALNNHRSLSSFKKKFKDYFNESPHRWVIRQRLMHARLQLISSNKSVTQIGAECHFPNISHFIKLFREEYGTTPANYRRGHHSEDLRPDADARQQKLKHQKELVYEE